MADETQTNERVTGVTIKELKAYLSNLPAEFDDFGMVNGEVAYLDKEVYARYDKPIVQLSIDINNKEFVLLHQTEAEVDEIMSNAGIEPNKNANVENGITEGHKE